MHPLLLFIPPSLFWNPKYRTNVLFLRLHWKTFALKVTNQGVNCINKCNNIRKSSRFLHETTWNIHLFKGKKYLLLLNQGGVPLKPKLRSLLMNLFFISEEVIKRMFLLVFSLVHHKYRENRKWQNGESFLINPSKW